MQFELSGQEVFIGFGIISMVLILLIAALRNYFKSNPQKNLLRNQYQLSERVKYASVDVFRHTKRLFGLALSISLLTVICGFSWTSYDRSYADLGVLLVEEDFISMEPPIIPPTAPKPPPPPPPVIDEIDNDEIIEEPDDLDDVFIDDIIPVEEPLPEVPTNEAAPPSPPPLAPIEEDVDPIFKIVEQMPLFGGCADQTCSDKALFKFLYKHLKYPAIAQENGIQGKVYIQFVVERDGRITDSKIVRDAGAGLGKESMRVIQKINELPKAFEPGRQRGEPVRVLFTLPVTFRLTN